MNYVILAIPVFSRILVLLSIVYSLRKFEARAPFRSADMAPSIRQVPLLVPSLRGITRKRDTEIIKPFTESRKREIPLHVRVYTLRVMM